MGAGIRQRSAVAVAPMEAAITQAMARHWTDESRSPRKTNPDSAATVV